MVSINKNTIITVLITLNVFFYHIQFHKASAANVANFVNYI